MLNSLEVGAFWLQSEASVVTTTQVELLTEGAERLGRSIMAGSVNVRHIGPVPTLKPSHTDAEYYFIAARLRRRYPNFDLYMILDEKSDKENVHGRGNAVHASVVAPAKHPYLDLVVVHEGIHALDLLDKSVEHTLTSDHAHCSNNQCTMHPSMSLDDTVASRLRHSPFCDDCTEHFSQHGQEALQRLRTTSVKDRALETIDINLGEIGFKSS